MARRSPIMTARTATTLVAGALIAAALSACGTQATTSPTPAAPPQHSGTAEVQAAAVVPSPAQTSTKPTSPAKAAPAVKPASAAKPAPAKAAAATPTMLRPGSSGARVLDLQKRLNALGYWNGTPDGKYGLLTSQAVMAIQKAAGLGRDGVYGPATAKAVAKGVLPKSRIGGTGIEIDKRRQLLLVVRAGKVTTVLNTSTGSGQTYYSRGSRQVALTPAGTFRVYRTVNGSDHGPLGDLWRPRYFNGGIAVHGAPVIPGYAASHGCARVSNPAMDMIWSRNLMPVGSRVVVY